MNITIEDAYREACTALGEATVAQRLLSVEMARLQAATPADDAEQPEP